MKKILLVLLLLTTPAFAAPLKQKAVGLPDPALVAKVEGYLNSIKTLQADFGQAANATIKGADMSSGRFYLQRPGKFRWEYLTGQQILIISNDSQIVYYDRKLDEVTHIPMQYSLASFLADENIKLSGKIKLVSIGEAEGKIRVVVTQAEKPEEGMLVLYFSQNPMQLTNIDVIDQDRNITAVAFRNIKKDAPLAKDLFIFKDPKLYKNVWERKK